MGHTLCIRLLKSSSAQIQGHVWHVTCVATCNACTTQSAHLLEALQAHSDRTLPLSAYSLQLQCASHVNF